MSGEFGNQLHHLAHGFAIQRLAKREYGIDTNLILRRQLRSEKFAATQRHLKTCFPALRDVKFQTDKFRVPDQQRLLNATTLHQKEMLKMFELKGGSTLNDTRRALDVLNTTLLSGEGSSVQYMKVDSDTTISLPFLHTSAAINREFMDVFYDDFREFFTFDRTACCSDLPEPDEAVFVSDVDLDTVTIAHTSPPHTSCVSSSNTYSESHDSTFETLSKSSKKPSQRGWKN